MGKKDLNCRLSEIDSVFGKLSSGEGVIYFQTPVNDAGRAVLNGRSSFYQNY